MQVQVTSFARRDEDLWDTPAAVFVITKEDIARSAATSIPELLRMVPGMQVAQIDAATWAISARGFNSAYSSKLLVLIDGRTAYSEIYSGAHWDQTDLPLEEVERIEVIRGPGAAVWGANAVNGVVNIITKRARSTAGTLTSARIGRIQGMSYLRYGGSLGDRIQYRAFASYNQRRPLELANGDADYDGENVARGGGRIDWQRNREDWMTLSGDLYGGHLKQRLRPEFAVPVGPNGQDPGSVAGGYLMGRWEHKRSRSDSALQAYFDDTSRHELGAYARTRTLDAEYQKHFLAGARHDLVWGAEVRFTFNHLKSDPPLTPKPDYNNYLVTGFMQDEFSLIPHRLTLTLGTKLQQGTQAGFQAQPTLRLLWAPTHNQSLWGAVSRAAVAPSIQDKDLEVPLNLGVQSGLPITGTLEGNPNIEPETVIAYEAGYRRKLPANTTLDIASFFNVNHRLLSLAELTPVFEPSPTPHLVSNLLYTNGFRARTAGVEAALSWKPISSVLFHGTYAWMQAQTRQVNTGSDGQINLSQVAQVVPGNVGLIDLWSTPRNSFSISASWAFFSGWSVNTFLSHADALPRDEGVQFDATVVNVPALTRLDLHLTHKVSRFLELDAGGTNLLQPRHVEFGSTTTVIVPDYIPRSLFVRARWTF